jgi:hypothetical protein
LWPGTFQLEQKVDSHPLLEDVITRNAKGEVTAQRGCVTPVCFGHDIDPRLLPTTENAAQARRATESMPRHMPGIQ